MELTEMLAEEYKRLQSGTMSPGMAAEYLKKGRIVLRTFADALRGIYPEGDLRQRLIKQNWPNARVLRSIMQRKTDVPRSATDWLVLYSIAAEDKPMSQRMEQVIELLYADQIPETNK